MRTFLWDWDGNMPMLKSMPGAPVDGHACWYCRKDGVETVGLMPCNSCNDAKYSKEVPGDAKSVEPIEESAVERHHGLYLNGER